MRNRHSFRCMVCGRFVGNTNLGGYMTDKTSKRGIKAYCGKCIDRLDGRDFDAYLRGKSEG